VDHDEVRASWAVSRGGAGCSCFVCQTVVLPRLRRARATEAELAALAQMAVAELEAAMKLDADECVVCEPEAISAFEGVGECMDPLGWM
jgi:hypothetical protein